MAEKGARAKLEPLARQLYVDGQSLKEVSETLDVSENTLRDWKARTRSAAYDLDEWDRAREVKRGFDLRLEKIRDDIMREIEESAAVSIKSVSPALYDSLSKVDALIERNRKSAQAAQDAIVKQRSEMFLQFVKDLIEFGQHHDQGLTLVIQDNFDDIIQWGREKYAA